MREMMMDCLAILLSALGTTAVMLILIDHSGGHDEE